MTSETRSNIERLLELHSYVKGLSPDAQEELAHWAVQKLGLTDTCECKECTVRTVMEW